MSIKTKLATLRDSGIYYSHTCLNNTLFKVLVLIALCVIFKHAQAEGHDIAEGFTDDAVATTKGTGMIAIYIVEFFIAVIGMIIKRSLMPVVFIFVISMFANYVFVKFLG